MFALGVLVLALWAQGAPLVGVFYDDGIYVTGAKALAEGAGYRNIHLPGTAPPPIVHYPILYSLVLSFVWRVWPAFPANVALFELANATMLTGAAWIVASHGRRLDLPAAVRWVALAAGFSAFPLLTILQLELSEPLFLLLVAAAVAVADREDWGARAAAAGGLLAGLATLAKSAGICAMAGVPLGLWLKGRRQGAALALAVAVCVVLPWSIWVAIQAPHIDPRLANYTTYFDEAKQAGIQPILEGLKLRAFGPLTALMLPNLSRWVLYPLSALMFVGLVWGGVTSARRVPGLVLSVAFYFLIISVWPFPPHRFVWIVLPWLLLLLGAGCAAAWRRGGPTRAAVLILLLALAYGYLPREAVSLAHRRFATAAEDISASFRVLTRSITAETPADAVVASEDEALIYLYTGRRSVPSHLFRWAGLSTDSLPQEERVRFWCQAGVTHLSVTSPGDPASLVVTRLGSRPDSVLTRLFQVTNGPGLYRFRCPR